MSTSHLKNPAVDDDLSSPLFASIDNLKVINADDILPISIPEDDAAVGKVTEDAAIERSVPRDIERVEATPKASTENFSFFPSAIESLENPLSPKESVVFLTQTENSAEPSPAINGGAAVTGSGGADTDTESKVDAHIVPTSGSIPMVSYHSDADTIVIVRAPFPAETLYYEVSSSLLAGASCAWKKTVADLSYLDQKRGKWVLKIGTPEDWAFGIDIVFSIVHYKFQEIPARPNVDELYSIARVVAAYDCAHLLVPFMEKWMSGLNWHIVMNGDQNDDEKTLHLTWVLGEARWFIRSVSKVAHTATLAGNGELLDYHGMPWKDHCLPEVILDMITKIRYDCLVKIEDAISRPMQALMEDGRKEGKKFCRSKDDHDDLKQACQLQQLGSLVSGLTAVGLLPFPVANEYRGSAADLAEKVKDIKVARFKLPGTPPHLDTHINCGIKHKDAVKMIMTANTDLSGDIIQQLTLRAKKSGAFSDVLFRDLNIVVEEDAKSAPAKDLHLNNV